MPGYLEDYGAGEEKRGKLIRRVLIGVVTVLVLGAVSYFSLRNYSENSAIQKFIAALQQKDYKQAYAMWGCTEAKPCRDYSFEKFMEDWGPKSPMADAAKARIEHPQLNPGPLGWIRNVLGIQYSCNDGVIYHVTVGNGSPVLLYVLRSDKTIGFAPWTVCAPHVKM
jgi:hypothetical protein